jgi:hypothetical protein
MLTKEDYKELSKKIHREIGFCCKKHLINIVKTGYDTSENDWVFLLEKVSEGKKRKSAKASLFFTPILCLSVFADPEDITTGFPLDEVLRRIPDIVATEIGRTNEALDIDLAKETH